MEILYNVAIYVVGHHTHKAGGSSLFCVPGTHAVHSKNGKYLPSHSTITLSVIVAKSRQKLQAIYVAMSLIIYKCRSMS